MKGSALFYPGLQPFPLQNRESDRTIVPFIPGIHRGIMKAGKGCRHEPHELGYCPRCCAVPPPVRCASEGDLAADFSLAARHCAAHVDIGYGRFPPGPPGHRRIGLHPGALHTGGPFHYPYPLHRHTNTGGHSHTYRSTEIRFRQALTARAPCRFSLNLGHEFGQFNPTAHFPYA